MKKPDGQTLFIQTESFEVASWSPGADGEGVPPTQVHVILDTGNEMIFVIRLKSRQITQSLIDALIEHRDYVWPR